jgi:hypothetical protein
MNAERENITEEKIEIIATVTGLVRVSSTKQGLQFWVEYKGRRKPMRDTMRIAIS